MDHRQRIQDSLDYIEDNIAAELAASELADRAGYSVYHYYRLFQSATGLPVMQYILRRRLLHAVFEVKQGKTRIDAALRYGFGTYAGFYRAFRREFGCTPSAFAGSCRASKPYRIDLMKEEYIMVTKKRAARLLENWGLETEPVTEIRYAGTGDQNENAYYVGDNYVLKFTANPGKLRNHIELSRFITSVGLAAAECIPTADGRELIQDGELYCCLTRRLPGKQLQPMDALENGRFLGEIIGQLHLAMENVECCVSDADLLATVRDWALPAARDALGLTEEFCLEYLETFERLYPQLPRQIIHRDPNPGNLILEGEKWGFIDFELSERNLRLYDPCYAATAILSENFDRAKDRWVDTFRDILAGYDSVVQLTDAEWKAAPYVVLANQLVCVAWFAGQEKYRDIFETNVAMTRWLIENWK